jgi:hypothetical protein
MTTTSNIEFKYNGKVYQQVPEISGCDYCAFEITDKACIASLSEGLNCGDGNGFIWVEKQAETKPTTEAESERTWTLKQICDAYYQWDNNTSWNELQQELVKVHERELAKQDPEYQQYLLLKAKFEGQQ